MEKGADRNKRIQEAAAIALRHKDELGLTVLNKILFYADLYALRDHGDTLTHAPYIALEMGPVVAGYEKRLVKGLVDAGCATQTKRKGLRFIHMPDKSVLQPFARELVERITDLIEPKKAKGASDLSHENIAWQRAYETGTGADVNLVLAMSQIVDDDLWLTSADDDADIMRRSEDPEAVGWT